MAPWEKIELNFAILESVQNLICSTFTIVFQAQQFLHRRRRQSLKHLSVLFFRLRVVSRTRQQFLGAAGFARASAEGKDQSRRCGGA